MSLDLPAGGGKERRSAAKLPRLTPWLTQCVTCRTEATTTRACESAK